MIGHLAVILLLGASASAELQEPRAIKLYRPTLREQLEKRGTAVTAENVGIDLVYYFDIKVGTPEQTVRAQLEAMNAVSALYGRHHSRNDPGFVYDPGFLSNMSSTFQNETAEVVPRLRADGTILATDKITLGNDTRDDVPFYPDETNRPMYKLTADYNDQGYGNYASWAFGYPNENETATSFWHKAAQGWADPRVGLFLSRHLEDPEPDANKTEVLTYADSEIMIGGVNQAKYTGEINMYRFQPGGRGGWAVPLEGVTVNGNTVPISANHTGAAKFTPPNNAQGAEAVEARIAVGSEMIHAPEEVVKAFYANIPGAGLVPPKNNPDNTTRQFPCNATTGVNVRLTIGGYEYTIQARDMVLGHISEHVWGPGWDSGATPDTGMCVGALVPSTYGWMLGTAFLKNVYTVFDFKEQAVGFATLAPDAQPEVKGTSSWAPCPRGISGVAVAMAAAVIALV